MQKKWISLLLAIVFIWAVYPLQAQLRSQIKPSLSVERSIQIPGLGSTSLGLSFLDPSRFSMNHSYSLSYMSFGKQSASMGIYQNVMSYVFSDKLVLNGHFGFMHDPMKMGNSATTTNLMDNLIYGAELTYRPKDNVLLNVRIDKAPYYSRYGYYPYRSRLSLY